MECAARTPRRVHCSTDSSCKIDTNKLVSDPASEKQMVEIAKALSFKSKLIIMDELSSSLTAEELVELRRDHPPAEGGRHF